jgi:hypothetical protein
MARSRVQLLRIATAACLSNLIQFVEFRSYGQDLAPDTQELLNEIGTSQGQVTDATLDGPYEDPRQQEIVAGRHSFFLTPWRAYMDTWPAKQYLDCLGVNFNVNSRDAVATATVLADAGFRSARVEFGWGNVGYDAPQKIRHPDEFRTTIQALQHVGIRPLVVLNANSAAPVPFKNVTVNLLKPAAVGAREIFVDHADLIRPGYTGFTTMVNQKMGFPLVIAVDSQTGRCELSAPLPHEAPAGKLALADLKYHPFSGTLLEDGTSNPFAEETVNGWRAYVATVCQTVKEDLGTEGQTDAGFDLEVWNEYTFGSDFLDERCYYDPARKFKADVSYQNHGLTCSGHEIILPITVDYVNDPANNLPGVHVISGFSNQRPWEDGASIWPGQTGFSRHYYTSLDPLGRYCGIWGLLSPATNIRPNDGPLNALGGVDGNPDGKDWYTVSPGTFFIPTIALSMPEALQYGYRAEYLTRDIQPFPGLWPGHFRYANPGDGHAAEFWMTETNTARGSWIGHIVKEQHLTPEDPRLIALSHYLGAKALLRTFVFQSHKGVHTIEVFAARGGDLALGVIPDAFFKTLQEENHQLTETVRAQTGTQLQVLSRVTWLMKSGQALAVTRPLSLTELVEHQPRLVSKGDGTREHPDRFNRDDFACLPFQLAADRYAIGYYVVTRNMVHEWKPTLEPLDPARYDMPEQTFDLTLQNLRGKDAKVSAWDPMTDQTAPVAVLAADRHTLKVRLETVDYPRFLLVQESQPGPLIVEPELTREPDGQVRVSFRTNLPVHATLSWGPWPQRDSGGRVELPKETSFAYNIPQLREHGGVQVTAEQDGLITPWPRWKYDTAGITWEAITDYRPTAGTVPPATVRLPGLPKSLRPTGYTSDLPEGLKWKEHGEIRLMNVGAVPAAMQVSLRVVTYSITKPLELLPEVSVLDQCVVEAHVWNSAASWRAGVKLDPTAHPGAPDLSQLIEIVPMESGWLVLKFQGTEAALQNNDEVIRQVTAHIHFDFGQK